MESCVVVGGAGIPSGNSQKLGTLLHTFPKNVGFYELIMVNQYCYMILIEIWEFLCQVISVGMLTTDIYYQVPNMLSLLRRVFSNVLCPQNKRSLHVSCQI